MNGEGDVLVRIARARAGHAAAEPRAETRALPAPTGRVLSVNVSPGGVPKLPVAQAHVAEHGLEGDRQREQTVHGGPTRAVSLLAIETIERLQAEGHPIEPGSAGENLTTAGVEVGRLPPGTRLLVGDDADASVLLELALPANPCKTIQDSFVGGRFSRLSAANHPGDTRVYAFVRHEGIVRPGDPIRVLPAVPGSDGTTLSIFDAYESVEASSTLALWQAAQAAGYDLRIVDDGELLMGSSPAVPGGAFNQIRGFDTLPHMLPRMRAFAAAAQHPVVLHARSQPWPDAVPQDVQVLHAAVPDGVARVKIAGNVTIREATPEESSTGIEILIAAWQIPEPLATVWRAIARVPARRGSHRVLAELEGVPVATGTVRVRNGTALLRGGAVLPSARGRGLHRALLAARAALAAALGADLLVVTAGRGSVSQRNLQRSGFRSIGEIGAYELPSAAAEWR